MFVKSADDLYIYAFVMVIGSLISQLFLCRFLRKYIILTKVKLSEALVHIKPNLTLFIPVIAISLYTIMDRVTLGALSSMTEVGYYENSNKLTAIPAMAITSLGTVVLPRMSNMITNGEKDKAMSYIQKSLIVSIILSTSMAFGFSAIGKSL